MVFPQRRFAVFLLVILSAISQAKISESSEWLVKTRQHTLITQFAQNSVAPETPNKNQVLVLIEAGAAYLAGPTRR